MTAKRFLDSRALEIWRTWAQRIPGQVIFFVSEGTPISEQFRHQRMPIVVLRGVSDTYPPQKKSFAMFRFLSLMLKFEFFQVVVRQSTCKFPMVHACR